MSINKDQSINYTNDPFPILTIENFLTKKQCDDLIDDASNIIKRNNSTIHGGRIMIPSTNSAFKNLVKESKNWNLLHKRINNQEILNLLLDNIANDKKPSNYKKWLNNKRFSISNKLTSIENLIGKNLTKKWKRILDKEVKSIPNNKLFLTLIINIIDDFYRIISSIIDYLFNKNNLILFYDYSISNLGYTRSIHRDSDSRVIVMLLYLNNLEKEVKGGSLEIYKTKKRGKYPPFIPYDESSKVQDIKPVAGKLVIFLNTANAYHAVSKMSHSSFGRHFIYGGFTMNSSFGSLALKGSKGKSPTEYYIYK